MEFNNAINTGAENVKPVSAHERIVALDALRVLAALIVLAQHFRVIFELTWPDWMSEWVFDDKAAVMLFFVLSGYVLALSLSNKAPSFTAYVKFGVRRILRLYPLYWAALLLAFLVLWSLHQTGPYQVAGLPVLYLDGQNPQLKQWLLHSTLVLPGINSGFALPTLWTLMTEARISMIFPLLAWAILRCKPWQAGAITAALVLGSDWLDRHVVGTAALIGMFALGTLLCRVPSALWSRLNNGAWWGLILLGIALYSLISFRFEMPSVWMANYLSGLGSLILIAGAIHWPLMRSTLTRLQNLLRVDLSYGIYILHYPVLVAMKKLCSSYIPVPPLLAFILVLGVTASLGLLLHFVIEKPSIELGRRLTRSKPALLL